MSPESPTFALKVDVDTFAGTRDGIPRLLGILEQFDVRATFYFSLGPDNSGKAVRRIFRRGFLESVLRTRGCRSCCLKSMLYGTMLPAPMIGESFPAVLRAVEAKGHEVGIHGWDHVKWHDLLPWLPKPMAALELGKASALFQEIFCRRARTTAAPGWTVSLDSLEIQDAMNLTYCSDARGTAPFYPVAFDKRYRTLQIPTTWPTADEVVGRNGIDRENLHEFQLAQLKPGLNVHTIHAEMEGSGLAPSLIRLLERLAEKSVTFLTLEEAAREFGQAAEEAPIAMKRIPGRAGKVAVQG